MKQPLLLTILIFSVLSASAQNMTNVMVAENNSNNTQQYSFANDMNPSYNQSINGNSANNIQIQAQTNKQKKNSSALQSFGNSGNNTNKKKTNANNPQVQTNVSNPVNNDNNNFQPYRGNVFQSSLDNNVGNESNNRGRGGNLINDININDNVQSNPVVNDKKKTVASKPVVNEYQGLDFKPSGLSGRDYSNGGKLKKGQKNFYSPSATKHKTINKKRPSHKKVKHHTSKCAKW